MQPELQQHMRDVIAGGPALLDENMFVGSRAAKLRALRAHANTISHVRFVAMEDSFPMLRERMGDELFHAAARIHLEDPAIRALTLRLIGRGFSARLEDPVLADLADAEWAMLQSYGAAEAPAIELATLRGLDAETLVGARVALHPAAIIMTLREPAAFSWPGMPDSEAPHLLITRPAAERRLVQVSDGVAALVERAQRTVTMGELFEIDAEGVTTLVHLGALRPQLELI
ncbi:DNA-binding domain-containing protein [Sphingomicrobium flavum]|uniref:DNA-binding domain-containing protein n=1 Tax=Sphingomicrobium flavum TaxID=1229164 RepID=UPI0021AD8AA3|nr:DNA-binding domain-containing protein [Sphingomicrobium flavum]